MPNSNTLKPRKCRHHWLVGLGVTVVVSGCSPIATAPSSGSSNLTSMAPQELPIQETINCGVILQGESARINQWIENKSDKAIRISKTTKSCECLSVRLSSQRIEPGKRALVFLDYEGSHAPDFVGSLQITVDLLDGGHQVGKIDVSVEVLSNTDPSNI